MDDDLDYDDTDGVSVTLWRGNPPAATSETIPGVLPPFMMTSGTMDAGTPVVIQWIDGRWRVVKMTAMVFFGKLDAQLDYDDATGVTVSIWTGKPASDSGDNVGGVIISELLMTSGHFDSGTAVRVEWIDERWYVTGAPC